MQNVYVIAKLEGAFWLLPGLGLNSKLSDELLDNTDRVGFVFYVNTGTEKEVSISIEDKDQQPLETGIPELDAIIVSSLAGVKDFRANLLINKQFICLTIVGGVWFGHRFKKRIIKGFEIARKIDELLKKRYEYQSWSGHHMKWDAHSKRFIMVSGVKEALFT
ncbi:hypothetical protein [Geotalea daltonii]|nr:hypothetical protein [Geotalea daltonii]